MQRGFWLLIIMILGWGVWQSNPPSLQAAGGGTTHLITVGANEGSGAATISANGQVVAFDSYASNLVPNDTNTTSDIFVYDTLAMTTTRVSVTSTGEQAWGKSMNPYLSADGRYVAFTSTAPNLDPTNGNVYNDGFIHDRTTGETTLVTVATDGSPGNAHIDITDLSADGRYVVFQTTTNSMVPMDKNGFMDVFVRDVVKGETTRISIASNGEEADGPSRGGTISADGRYVAFLSEAPNLGSGPYWTIFVHDRTTGESQRIASGSRDTTEAMISDNGAYVVFSSSSELHPDDTNLNVDIYRATVAGDVIELVSRDANGNAIYMDATAPTVSADGRYVLFNTYWDEMVPGDTNHFSDLYRWDMEEGRLMWVSQGMEGAAANDGSYKGVLSGDGVSTAFVSAATNLSPEQVSRTPNIYLRSELTPPPPTPTPPPPAHSLYLPGVVAETGIATYPRLANITQQANGDSFAPVADESGETVAFLSDANNLVADDTNSRTDVFVWQKQSNTIQRVSVASNGTQANGDSTWVTLASEGRYLLFMSDADNLAAGNPDGSNLYRHDLETGITEWVSIGLNGVSPNGLVTGADISADGRWVVFSSQARNITESPLPVECLEAVCETLYRRDMATGVTETLFKDGAGMAMTPLRYPSLSADGQSVVFEKVEKIGETRVCGQYWVPVYGPVIYRATVGDPQSMTVVVRSHYEENIHRAESDENCLMGYIFHNIASYPVVADREGSVLYDYGHYSATQYSSSSGGGASVAYGGAGGGTSLFNFTTESSFRPEAQTPTGDYSQGASLSADGEIYAFAAGDLRRTTYTYVTPEFPDDTNQHVDVYLFNRNTNRYQRITNSATGERANGDSVTPYVAGNGRVIVFASDATNLMDGDTNGVRDILLWESVR